MSVLNYHSYSIFTFIYPQGFCGAVFADVLAMIRLIDSLALPLTWSVFPTPCLPMAPHATAFACHRVTHVCPWLPLLPYSAFGSNVISSEMSAQITISPLLCFSWLAGTCLQEILWYTLSLYLLADCLSPLLHCKFHRGRYFVFFSILSHDLDECVA